MALMFSLLYLPFAAAAAERYPNADDLAGFFGLFWAGVTLVASVVSILLTNRLFARFGVGVMVILLPLLYTSGFGILLVESGFVMLVAVRFAMGVWLQGVALPGWETLINVIPEQRRDATRAFLMGGPTQLGTVTAGVVALATQGALTTGQFAGVGGLDGQLADAGGQIRIEHGRSGFTIERFTGNRHGAIYGWALTPGRTGSKRRGHDTPVDGLFLSGAWTQEGPASFRVVLSGVQGHGRSSPVPGVPPLCPPCALPTCHRWSPEVRPSPARLDPDGAAPAHFVVAEQRFEA
jgi:hypothetical protein